MPKTKFGELLTKTDRTPGEDAELAGIAKLLEAMLWDMEEIVNTTKGPKRYRFERSLKIKESADAVADSTAYGQLWVKTATPNTLMFTNDAGADFTVDVTSAV